MLRCIELLHGRPTPFLNLRNRSDTDAVVVWTTRKALSECPDYLPAALLFPELRGGIPREDGPSAFKWQPNQKRSPGERELREGAYSRYRALRA